MNMIQIKPLEEIIKKLPPEALQEVEDFASFLLEKKHPQKRQKPTFNWVGALENINEPLSSVELQHEVSKWRTEEL